MRSKSKTLLEALATGQPQILAALAVKWDVPIPVTRFGYRNYWQLGADLAAHALEANAKDEPGTGWYNADFANVVSCNNEGDE